MTDKTSAKAVKEEIKTEPAADANKPQYDKAELLAIFDEMIFQGEYQEEVTIKGKLKVTFRARSANDITAISRELDGSQFSLMATITEQRAFLNLIYSMIAYAGKNYEKVEIKERREMIGKLPAVVIGALSEALVKFDQKMDAACREGEANF